MGNKKEINKNYKLLKIFLLCIIGILFTFLIISLSSSLYLNSTKTTNNYSFDRNYNDIEILGDNFDVIIYPSITEEDKAKCVENKKMKFDIQVINNTIFIKLKDERNIIEKIFNFVETKIELYLNKQTLNNLLIKNDTGDITISKYLTFNDVTIKSSTGDIDIKIDEANSIDIKSSTGDIEIEQTVVNKKLTLLVVQEILL